MSGAPAGRRMGFQSDRRRRPRLALDILLKREFEAEPHGARLQRRNLVGTSRDRRAEGKAVADIVGKVGDGQRYRAALIGGAQDQAGIDIFALLLTKMGADAKPRAADV